MTQPSFDPGYLRSLFADLATTLDRSQAIGERLRDAEYEGTGGSDEITATVTGLGVLRRVHIATLAKRRLDAVTLAEQVVQAINAAQDEARQARDDAFAEIQVNGVSLTDLMAGLERQPRTG